jgi:16S rRNA (guanine966-N2)-methyltransferase
VREAIFSIVGPVEGLDALDLFAGSGALGLEALSRGAASATFVDRSARAAGAIRANLASLGLEDRARVIVRDWRAALRAERAASRTYGLCLIDPPYSLTERIVAELAEALTSVLTGAATIVLEHSASLHPLELPRLGIVSRTDRTYGETAVSVMRRGAD